MSEFGGSGDDELPQSRGYPASGSGYALSGRIMLSAIIILFFVVVLMLFLHLYARWYLLRSRRRGFLRRNRHNRRTHLVFYLDPATPATSRGLDASVLKSLPIVAYSAEGRPEPLECAVCLCEFEEAEKARLLPKCGHSFHIDCIDMWFQSHSTCPLCRSPVEPVESPESQSERAGAGAVSDHDSISGLCAECHCDESAAHGAGPSSSLGGSSFGGLRKPQELVGVSIEVPTRTEFDEDRESPASLYRSPMSRMLSFRKILSRERRGPLSPTAASCSAAELDLERGREETHRLEGPTRPPTH